MFYNAPNSAMILRRAAMGPAAIAEQKQNFQNIRRGIPQKNYISNDMMRRGGSMGALGDGMPGTAGAIVAGGRTLLSAPKGESTVSKVEDISHAAGAAVTSATAAGAASAAIAGMGYGAVAGPIGAAVGLVVGLAIGALTKKNYANLAQINQLMDHEVLTLAAYQKVAGKAAGRHYGLKAMETVWRGGIEKGLFPKMQSKMHYHEGWTKYIGGAEMASKVIREAFPRALPKFRVWKKTAAGIASKKDAVVFVEQFLRLDPDTDIPPTATGGAAAMQIVYDTADAYLGTIPGLVTVPYMPLLPPKVAPKPVAKVVAKIAAPAYVQPKAAVAVGPGVAPTAPVAGTNAPALTPSSSSVAMTAPAVGAPAPAPVAATGPTVASVVTAASGIPWGPILTIGAAILSMKK